MIGILLRAGNPVGRVVAVIVMLTTIPLLAAVFALITGRAAAEGLRTIMDITNRTPDGVFRLLVGSNPAVPAMLDELVRADIPVVLVADVDPATGTSARTWYSGWCTTASSPWA